MADYLFLFTIGPVQEFIAAARRTRDLWAGSKLLSALSRTAAQAFLDQYQAELIFPAKETLADPTRDIPNRILVQLSTEDAIKDVGDAIEKAVRDELASICEATLVTSKKMTWPKDKGKNHYDKARLQIADLVEIYWSATERIQKPIENYEQDRKNVEAALAARKNTRDFVQPVWASNAPKSSIDGLRESVINEDEFAYSGVTPQEKRKIADRLFARYGAKRAERLSGVDLLKRHYRPRHIHADFPSTSHFAALPLLERCHEKKLDITRGLDDYLNTLRQSYIMQDTGRRLESMHLDWRFGQAAQKLSLRNYDASILFASRLEEDLDGEALKKAREAFGNYRKLALGNKEPDPY